MRVQAWPAGTTRRGLLLFDLASVAALIMLQSLALRAGATPEVSWRPALAGTALVWAAALAGYRLPARRRSAGVPPALDPLLAELTAAAGVTRAPQFAVNPRALGSGAVTLGRRGRYRIVLDAGLVHRAGTARLTAVVLHELAHVRNGDVELARFTVLLWRVVSIAVLLPFAALALWSHDTGDLWLAAATWTVSALLYAETLRRRELYADRDAVTCGADPDQWAVPAGRRRRPRISLLRTHPAPGVRRRALGDPGSSAASSMIGDSLLGTLLTVAAFGVLALLSQQPALEAGSPSQWPHLLSAVVGYGSTVISLAALLTPPSQRFRVPGAQYVPLAVRRRRTAAIILTVIFGAVATLLFAFDPAHLVRGDWPVVIPLPPMPLVTPPQWETPRSAAISVRVRAWLTAGGGTAALTQAGEDRQALRNRIKEMPPTRIDWTAFRGDCAALIRDASGLDARGPFPVAAAEPARITLRDELRAATVPLCGPGHHYTSREFRPLEYSATHLARANNAAGILTWAEQFYVLPK